MRPLPQIGSRSGFRRRHVRPDGSARPCDARNGGCLTGKHFSSGIGRVRAADAGVGSETCSFEGEMMLSEGGRMMATKCRRYELSDMARELLLNPQLRHRLQVCHILQLHVTLTGKSCRALPRTLSLTCTRG